jgi:hypothetical protein
MKSQMWSRQFLHHPAQYLLLRMECAQPVRVRVLALCPVAVGGLPPPYVDTGLYEGGRRDWFEAFTPQDLTWARRMDYVLRRHNICCR